MKIKSFNHVVLNVSRIMMCDIDDPPVCVEGE